LDACLYWDLDLEWDTQYSADPDAWTEMRTWFVKPRLPNRLNNIALDSIRIESGRLSELSGVTFLGTVWHVRGKIQQSSHWIAWWLMFDSKIETKRRMKWGKARWPRREETIAMAGGNHHNDRRKSSQWQEEIITMTGGKHWWSRAIVLH
jgi:hypothetical protein